MCVNILKECVFACSLFYGKRSQDFGWACLRVAVRQKFADELAKHPDGLHVDALSKKVGVHPMKLASILRVLAAKHCFREGLLTLLSIQELS